MEKRQDLLEGGGVLYADFACFKNKNKKCWRDKGGCCYLFYVIVGGYGAEAEVRCKMQRIPRHAAATANPKQ